MGITYVVLAPTIQVDSNTAIAVNPDVLSSYQRMDTLGIANPHLHSTIIIEVGKHDASTIDAYTCGASCLRVPVNTEGSRSFRGRLLVDPDIHGAVRVHP